MRADALLEAPVDWVPPKTLGVQLERQAPLASMTTMKVGGPAEYFATVNTTDQLLKLVRWARSVSLPYFMLGGGSNILISDAGIRGLVIHNRCRQVRIDEAPCCQFPRDDRPYLMAESGAAMAGVARTSIRAGLTGLEWGVSVPGTIGGAVVGNAGAHGGEIKDTLEYAMLLDGNGEIQEYKVADFHYAYRDSSLKRLQPLVAGFKPVVLSANFRLERGDASAAAARAEHFLQSRRRTQPVEPSLGSTFVNPPGDYAGRLIEAAGLKGYRCGGAAVSTVHANFIVNAGGVGSATASDVLALIEEIERIVADRMHVHLEREVQLVGEWSAAAKVGSV
ncbi:MAG: UDP-N-acetylmuramate dehydrogenase [Caldilineaceae bacterium]